MTWNVTSRLVRFGALGLTGALALVGCDSDTEAPAPDALATSAEAGAVVAPEATVVSERLSWIDFEGTFDPDAGTFELRTLEPADTGALRGIDQALYCERRTTNGRPDTFGLSTQPGTIGFTPTDCGFPDTFPYDTLGMFCATIDVTSYFRENVPAVFAEVTGITPDIGHNGYQFPNGTGADPADVIAGFGEPIDTAGGLWSYGALEPSETGSVQWTFEYTPEPFTFRGRILAAVPEQLNGVDDNCDGEIDERPLAAGEACTDDTDCYHGSCSMNVCVDPDATCPAGFWGPGCANVCGCDDGLFCNGEEICDVNLGCLAGTPPDVDDGVGCTDDSCDEVTDSIVNTPNAGLCDNGLFCDGVEICDPTLDCQDGPDPTDDDGVGCTDDVCNETTDSFDHTPNNGLCDNGQFCDGVEFCDATLDCQDGADPVVDDGIGCTMDTCDEVNDVIVNATNDGLCDNGQFCDGAEVCTAGVGCESGTAPVTDDGIGCTMDTCDEVNDVIVNAPNDGLCDNGAFCDGAEVCSPTLDCQAGTPPTLSDGVGCTDDTCDEVNDVVVNTVNDANCDNGQFCDGAETCHATLDCQAGTPPTLSDGVGCTDDTCDEVNDVVVNTANDANCDNSNLCDGIETCSATLDCQPGTALDCDDGNVCTDDSCDPGLGCLIVNNTDPCDDGNDCTSDICGGGTCNGTNVADESGCTQCESGACACWTGECANLLPYSVDHQADMTQDCIHNTGDTSNDAMDGGGLVFVTDALFSFNLPASGFVVGTTEHPPLQMHYSDADSGNNCWNAFVEGGSLVLDVPPYEQPGSILYEAESDPALGHNTGFDDGAGAWAAGTFEAQNHMIYGPYVNTLREGAHTVDFRMKIDVVSGAEETIVTLDVWDATAGQQLAIWDVQRSEFPGDETYGIFSLDFDMVGRAGHTIETRVYHYQRAYTRVDWIEIREQLPNLHIIGTSTEGSSDVGINVSYLGGGSNSVTHTFPDWFDDGVPGVLYMFDNLDRISTDGTGHQDNNDPALFYTVVDLTDGIDQVTLTQTGGSGRFNFFGLAVW